MTRDQASGVGRRALGVGRWVGRVKIGMILKPLSVLTPNAQPLTPDHAQYFSCTPI
jgi:hypothetical protein